MCARDRVGLAAWVGALCCSLAWFLTIGTVVRGEDERDALDPPSLKITQPDEQPGYQQSEPQSDQSNYRQAKKQAEPQPIKLAGKGRQASEKFVLEPGLCVFDVKHEGDSNLIIRLLDRNGDEIDTVFNQIGPFNGERGIYVPKGGQCLLDVQADGNWTANLRQPRPDKGLAPPCSLEGKGYKVTPFIKLDKGLTVFKMNHEGASRFKVVLTDRDGRVVEYLANTLGPFSGSKPASIEKPGLYFLNVSADGDWTLDLQ